MDVDVLMARVVDGEATAEEWEAWCAQADARPALWRDLAWAQRVQTLLAAEVERTTAVAETIEAPGAQRPSGVSLGRVGAWGGWLAAALALAWAAGLWPGSQPGVQTAGVAATPASPAEALAQYLDQGQRAGVVLGELPAKVMLNARPLAGQGYEVLYLRQILERQVVPEFFGVAEDELGRPTPVRVEVVRSTGHPM